MKTKRLKALLIIASIITLYPILMYLSNPQIYPTHATVYPKGLKDGFYLVLNTKTSDLPSHLNYKNEGNQTYVGPLQNIKTSHLAHMQINHKHPGIQTHLIKLDTTHPSSV
jgi:hypothetical protein